MRKLGFTLAEIMIALTIIGVITAILLPVARNSLPNEKVMKFKKANATLHRVINELVTSGEYYTPGDLGVKPNGEMLSSENEDDIKYLCETINDVLNIKSKNCSENKTGKEAMGIVQYGKYKTLDLPLEEAQNEADKICKERAEAIGEELVTVDNIIFYQTAPNIHFGIYWDESAKAGNDDSFVIPSHVIHKRLFGKMHATDEGFDRIYKTFCMDIDGINKGEDPFGYGIRSDGKILLGKRAQAWLEKDIQDKE